MCSSSWALFGSIFHSTPSSYHCSVLSQYRVVVVVNRFVWVCELITTIMTVGEGFSQLSKGRCDAGLLFLNSRVAQRGGGLSSSAARSEHEVSEIIDGISEHEVSGEPGPLSWS